MAVFEELQEIISSKLSLDPSVIKMEASFIDDLDADSLDLADLVMAIEEKYETDFADEADQFTTVGDVVTAIEKLKG